MTVIEHLQEPRKPLLAQARRDSTGDDDMEAVFSVDQGNMDWIDFDDWLAYGEADDDALDKTTDDETLTDSSRLIDDTFGLYLDDIGQVPLLSSEQEMALAKTMERGYEAQKQLTQFQSALSSSLANVLQQRIEDGHQARQQFIEANTRLVVGEAKRYQHYGLTFLDLIQAGNVGLIKAVDHFDYRKGNRFSTYATWWIRQTIRRALTEQSHTIRLPSHIRQRVLQYRKTARQLEKSLRRRPTPEEIADALGVKKVRHVRRLLQIGQKTLSLNALSGENGDNELLDIIADDSSPPAFQQLERSCLKHDIQRVMDTVLNPREKEVLSRRFGLNGCVPQTLQDLADDFGVSRERVRQIERRALRKLRSPSYSRRLCSYLS